MLIWALLLLGLVGLIVIVIVLNPARSVAPAGPPVSIDLIVPPSVCRGEMVEVSWTTEGGQAFFTLGTAELDPADERIIFSRLPVPAHYDSLRVEVMEDRLRFTIDVEASHQSFVVEAGECGQLPPVTPLSAGCRANPEEVRRGEFSKISWLVQGYQAKLQVQVSFGVLDYEGRVPRRVESLPWKMDGFRQFSALNLDRDGNLVIGSTATVSVTS